MVRLEPSTIEDTGGVTRLPLALSTEIVYGSFPQASSAIYHDYEDMIDRAIQGETDQGIVDNLLEAPADLIPISEPVDDSSGERALDKVPDAKLNFVLPSDGSQDAVVVESQTAPCVVVRGPPGTGKSQVIVNLISNALSRGEKVLLI